MRRRHCRPTLRGAAVISMAFWALQCGAPLPDGAQHKQVCFTRCLMLLAMACIPTVVEGSRLRLLGASDDNEWVDLHIRLDPGALSASSVVQMSPAGSLPELAGQLGYSAQDKAYCRERVVVMGADGQWVSLMAAGRPYLHQAAELALSVGATDESLLCAVGREVVRVLRVMKRKLKF